MMRTSEIGWRNLLLRYAPMYLAVWCLIFIPLWYLIDDFDNRSFWLRVAVYAFVVFVTEPITIRLYNRFFEITVQRSCHASRGAPGIHYPHFYWKGPERFYCPGMQER